MKRSLSLAVVLTLSCLAAGAGANPPIYVAFHWHMHQPIYWPYESVVQTADNGRYGFSVTDVHTSRTGPYTAWPMDAVQSGMGAGLAHLGAQVSLSGSLMENLDALDAAGRGFDNWTSRWSTAMGWATTLGNPRVDLVAFGYHHPLMALIDPEDIGLQIAMHRVSLERHFGGAAGESLGIFPPETAFRPAMIPALVDAGIEWVIVDNIHFDRARPDYPYSPGSNLYPPNPADQRDTGGNATFLQLNGLWAGSQVSAPWGYQPHWVAHVDPDTGEETRIIAVPAARYEGNEDGRGGFGALQYEQVFSQYEHLNTDDDHPMLVLLHHDGDNYGGGTDSYYHGNFDAFVSWLQANPDRFVATTVQDYLDQFPPDDGDVIHVEPGSWSGADNGDPEFLKWNGDPNAGGYSPDRASWAVVTAAHDRVATAAAVQPPTSVEAIVDNTGNHTARAYHYFLNAEASDYWYWDFAEGGTWDSHPARACNQAVAEADQVLVGGFSDTVAPSVYAPQRQPYNPGGLEWGPGLEASDFTVWTYVADVSGLSRVVLRYRVDDDGAVDHANLLRSGGTWQELAMTASAVSPQTNPAPTHVATEYRAEVTGYSDTLIDYFVEAEDTAGNVARSEIEHVYIGELGGGAATGVVWSPRQPCHEDAITISGPHDGWLHWGVDGWTAPAEEYWPAGTTLWNDGLAVESPLDGPNGDDRYSVVLGPFDGAANVDVIDFVMHHDDDTWDNNNGSDYHLTLRESCEPIGPGPTDTGTPDAGPSDAGSDAGDTGAADAGSEAGLDAGDAGSDGPRADGEGGADAATDGAGGADSSAGGDTPSDTVKDVGCDCTVGAATGPGAGLAWLLAAAVWGLRRRRRLR